MPGSGYTNVEIVTDAAHIIVEAKRGWDLPTHSQLAKYAPSLIPDRHGTLVAVAECTPEYVSGRLPEHIDLEDGRRVRVLFRPWRQLHALCTAAAHRPVPRVSGECSETCLATSGGLIDMRDPRDNMVYVVSLGDGPAGDGASITWRQIVQDKNVYFHPVGNRWPKEPWNYYGFRWDGMLQEIRHVESYTVFDSPQATVFL